MSYYLTLTDDNATVYTFPHYFFVKSGNISSRISVREHVHDDGGRQSNDGRYNARVVTVEGWLFAASAAAFETALRAMMQAVLKGGKLKINGDSVNRYIDVRKPSIDYEYRVYPLTCPITLTFIAQYPFWVDTTETTDANVLAGNGSFTTDASGSDYIIKPVIQIAADQGADLPGIKLRNVTDGSMYFVFNYPSFYSGGVFVMDCAEGTIKVNNNSVPEYLVEPSSFLRLQPMVNTFEYEGNAATVSVKFRKVYVI